MGLSCWGGGKPTAGGHRCIRAPPEQGRGQEWGEPELRSRCLGDPKGPGGPQACG